MERIAEALRRICALRDGRQEGAQAALPGGPVAAPVRFHACQPAFPFQGVQVFPGRKRSVFHHGGAVELEAPARALEAVARLRRTPGEDIVYELQDAARRQLPDRGYAVVLGVSGHGAGAVAVDFGHALSEHLQERHGVMHRADPAPDPATGSVLPGARRMHISAANPA